MIRKDANNRKQEKPNDLEELEEGPKAEIHIDLLKTTLNISNWKTPCNDGIHGFLFKKVNFIYDRLALEMNRYLQEAHVPERMT